MIKIDNLIAHDSRVQRANVVGGFCHVPIVTLDELGMDVDVEADLAMRMRFTTGQSIPAEVLPGEEICEDHIIRRTTTAEAMGYDVYYNQVAIEAGTKRGCINLGRLASLAGELVHWRPNGDVNPETEFVLIGDGI